MLAKSLAEAPALTEALSRYEQARVARTRRVVLESRGYGRMAQLEHPMLTWARDLALRLTPASAVERRTRALLDFRI